MSIESGSSTNTNSEASEATQRLGILASVAALFAEVVMDEGELFRVVAEQVSLATGDACTVRLLSEDRAWLQPVAVHHPNPQILSAMAEVMKQTAQRATTGIWQPIIDDRKSIRLLVSPEAMPPGASPQQIEFMNRFPIRQIMGVPLVARSRVIGGISLVRYKSEPLYSLEDELFMRDLADRAALAIDNARLITAERHARETAERAEAIARKELEERRKVEAALAESERKFLHAQKMEAVGRLAGGVAHDFNNILSVVLSYSEMLRDELSQGDPLREDLDQINQAGQRAATLTRQLLAFSRQQVLDPRVLSINSVISDVEKMLRRILGADVDLTLHLDANLANCKLDPGQLEQILMNLIINAKDAMPSGGRLMIETANVMLDSEYVLAHPEASLGPNVVLAVSDTGTGMDQETLTRIFEPFFTTKPKEKGTGLGLSTVYGIVKQSGGSIWVYSEIGSGTTFKIYFPHASEPRGGFGVPLTKVVNLRGSETVLLVEDEEQLRTLVRTILRGAGYNVLEASNGGEALLLYEQYTARIHLLLTDVVMPKMSGRQLAERLIEVRRDLKVLYMSGYTEDAIIHHGILTSGINYLQKPLTPDLLLRKVRQVLDE